MKNAPRANTANADMPPHQPQAKILLIGLSLSGQRRNATKNLTGRNAQRLLTI